MRLLGQALLLCAFLLVTFRPEVASADDDKAIKDGFDRFAQTLTALKSKGQSVRGASDSLSEILESSDKAMCAAWEIQWRNIHHQLAFELNRESDIAEQARIMESMQKLHDLHSIIARVCDKILNPEAYAQAADADEMDDDENAGEEEPAADCDEDCQRRRAAYYQALDNFIAADRSCRWLAMERSRLEALPLVVERVREELRVAERDLANAQSAYDRDAMHSNLVARNKAQETVDQLSVTLATFERLANGANLAAMKAAEVQCRQRLENVEEEKDKAAFALFGRTTGPALRLIVRTTTGTATDAYTDETDIFVSINGDANHRLALDNPNLDDFENGEIDTFEVEFHVPPSSVSSILLDVEGDDAWLCERISFRFAYRDRVSSPTTFEVGEWFSQEQADDGIVRKEFPISVGFP